MDRASPICGVALTSWQIGNLDRESAGHVMELLKEINKEERTTFLISTHDEKIAAAYRRQVRVVDGTAVADEVSLS